MNKRQEEMLKELLLDYSDRLTANEAGFLDDLDRKYRNKDLSDKQVVWLEDIWERIFG